MVNFKPLLIWQKGFQSALGSLFELETQVLIAAAVAMGKEDERKDVG